MRKIDHPRGRIAGATGRQIEALIPEAQRPPRREPEAGSRRSPRMWPSSRCWPPRSP